MLNMSYGHILDEIGKGDGKYTAGATNGMILSCAVSLIRFVFDLQVNKVKYAKSQSDIENIILRTDRLSEDIIEIISAEVGVYQHVLKAKRLPANSANERACRVLKIDEALKQAADPQMALLKKASEALDLLTYIIHYQFSGSIISDLKIVCHQLETVTKSTSLLAEQNYQRLSNKKLQKELLENLHSKRGRALKRVAWYDQQISYYLLNGKWQGGVRT